MIRVTCAIIEHEGLILSAQRSSEMSLPMKWEFPGGKLEDGENPVECILREIREELNLDVLIVHRGPSVFHDYGVEDKLELIPFICRIAGGELKIREHHMVRWCSEKELERLDWAAADLAVLDWWRSRRVRFNDR